MTPVSTLLYLLSLVTLGANAIKWVVAENADKHGNRSVVEPGKQNTSPSVARPVRFELMQRIIILTVP
jgi:hypothetical protein